MNKDGIIDIKEYIVVSCLGSHFYKNSTVDYEKLEDKLQSLRVSQFANITPLNTNYISWILPFSNDLDVWNIEQ